MDREREIYTQLNVEFQKISRRDKKTFLSEICKEIKWKRLESSTINLEISQQHLMQIWTP